MILLCNIHVILLSAPVSHINHAQTSVYQPTEEIEKKLEKLPAIEKMEKSVLIGKIINRGIDVCRY